MVVSFVVTAKCTRIVVLDGDQEFSVVVFRLVVAVGRFLSQVRQIVRYLPALFWRRDRIVYVVRGAPCNYVVLVAVGCVPFFVGVSISYSMELYSKWDHVANGSVPDTQFVLPCVQEPVGY